ncbi:MAM and LDL-receptor class A domain-containing protein 2-like [Aricia agestis]|uniref:MAM and LDL-receptor class A domain-containing protein 2-like n=1 Tax=Aricia agestis TaxID=91739 RepID=UPI001C20291C|nr:MAM and LDL-receptor class A domain-containing protein 2-like [Aricia agestis]
MFLKCLLLLFYLGLLDGLRASYPARIRVSSTCTIPTLANGKLKLRQRGRLVRFQCNPQYTLVGSRYASCVNGRWDEPLPVCIRPGCDVMGIDNGMYIEHSAAWVVYFCLPGYSMLGSQVVYCDGSKWNATAPTCVDRNQPTQLSCDFESEDLCGWVQDELHNFDWERKSRKTPSSFLFTGPSWDHTLGSGNDGHYMYIESSSKSENDTARLISPVFSGARAKDGCFSFYYHMYGATCGGLRVYQKPDTMILDNLLMMSEEDKKNYILFERWGNLGDVWLHSVTNLTDYNDSFQIIIEGIRGRSYTSDIAIDDVAILQGENCTLPENPTTPAIPDSCAGRCDGPNSDDSMCGCSTDCFDLHNCCPDFFDLCVFGYDQNPVSKGTTEPPPRTQKLINSTTDATESTTAVITSTTTTPKPTTTTPKPTTTTPKPTTTTPKPTTTKPTTTPRPTTKPTTTTTKPTTTRTKPTTTPKPTTTTMKPTPKPTQKATTIKPTPKTTTKPVVKTTPKTTRVTLTTLSTKTTKLTTITPKTTTDKREIHDEEMRKERKEKTIELKKLIKDERKGPKPGMSGFTVTVITLGVIMSLAGVVWFGLASRTERGRIVLSRLRGRIRNDAEVRFLSANMEED